MLKNKESLTENDVRKFIADCDELIESLKSKDKPVYEIPKPTRSGFVHTGASPLRFQDNLIIKT